MNLIIAKVDETLFSGDVASVTLPGAAGELTVLPHHAPLITGLKAGEIRIRKEKDSDYQIFTIEKGLLEVNAQGATVLL